MKTYSKFNRVFVTALTLFFALVFFEGAIAQADLKIKFNNLLENKNIPLGDISEITFNQSGDELIVTKTDASSSTDNLSTIVEMTFNGSLELDSLALVALYNSTNGPNWEVNTNWLEGPVSSWFGVSVTDGRVSYLSLFNNNLSGPLPQEIGDLIQVTALVLWGNQLTGELPTTIGNLINLQTLSLDDNMMTGPIPATVAELANLAVLALVNNKFTKLPDFSGLLGDGFILTVQNNRFEFDDLEPNIDFLTSYAPQDSIGAVHEKIVDLGSQLILKIKAGGTQNIYKWFKDGILLGGQTNDTLTVSAAEYPDAGVYSAEVNNEIVTGLTLYSRPITVLVEALTLETDSLALVALYNATGGAGWTENSNWLEGPVSSWYGITVANNRVTEVKLNENGLMGNLPPEIGRLTKLTELSLNGNKLGSGSSSLPKTAAGEDIFKNIYDINDNNDIPQGIGNLSSLGVLNLGNNLFTGLLPNVIGNLTLLTSLDVGFNQLTGDIPEDIGNLTQLTSLILGNNGFSGLLPNSLTNLTDLLNLDISNTDLGVPDEPTFLNWFNAIPVLTDAGLELSDESDLVPGDFGLAQNYPNPFNPSTTIKYALAEDGMVKIDIYNIVGQKMIELVNTNKRAGYYEVVFNADKLASGVYIYIMQSNNFIDVKKMMFMK